MRIRFECRLHSRIHGISNVVKIRVVGFEMFNVERQTDGWADGQTDFSNAPKTVTFPEDWHVIPIGNSCARGICSEVNLAVAMP